MGVGKPTREERRLTARVIELGGRVLEMDEQLQEAVTEIEQLKAQLAAEREEKEALKAEVARLKEKETFMEDLVDVKETEKLEAEYALRNARQQIAQFGDTIQSLHQQRGVMEGNLNAANAIIAQRDHTIGHLQAANAQLQAVLNDQPPVPLVVIPPADADLSDDGSSGIEFEEPSDEDDMDLESDGDNHAM